MSRKVEDLHPAAARKCRALLEMAEERGVRLILTSTLRNAAEQKALYAQERKPLRVVNSLRLEAGLSPLCEAENRVFTRAPVSVHQFGCAFDVAVVRDGVPAWDVEADLNENGVSDYEARVKKLNASDGVLSAVVKDSSSGAVIRYEKILVPSGATKTVTLGQNGGGWATEFILMPHGLDGSFEVYYMKKTVTVVEPPEEEDFKTYAPPVELASYRGMGIERTPALKPAGKVLAWAFYPATSHGTIDRQTHFAELANTGSGEAKVRLVAAEAGGSCLDFAELSIAAGASGTISLPTRAAAGTP